MTIKRSRGRPRGSGKNDAPFLNQIADELLKCPELKPTTVMKRLLHKRQDWNGASEDAVLRRWQVKWQVSGNTFMAQARERAVAVRTVPGRSYMPHYGGVAAVTEMIGQSLRAHDRMQDMINPPGMRAALDTFAEMERSSRIAAQRIQDVMNTPGMRAALDRFAEMQRSQRIAVERVQDMINQPGVRSALDSYTNMQRMQEAIDPRGFRTMIDELQQRLIDQSRPRRPRGY